MTLKHVLIVCPRFPPANAADSQRVRMLLPHLAAHGWRATVLCSEYEPACGPYEPGLAEDLPHVRILRYRPWSARFARWGGIGSLGIRGYRALGRLFYEVIARDRPDIIFVSNTEFLTFHAASIWSRRTGIPYVLDWQDPWVSDYYSEHPEVIPPGGKVKYWISQTIARLLERGAVLSAAHHIVVSPDYISMLCRRYGSLGPGRFTEMPFGFAERDLARATEATLPSGFRAGIDWVYTGRCGPDMRFALSCILEATAMACGSGQGGMNDTKLWFVGTNYTTDRSRQEDYVIPVARHFSVSDRVIEIRDRQPFHVALRMLQCAGAQILLGSDDPSYNASKVLTCIAARTPIIGVVRQGGPLEGLLGIARGAVISSFIETSNAAAHQCAQDLFDRWFRASVPPRLDIDEQALGRHESAYKAKILAQILDESSDQSE